MSQHLRLLKQPSKERTLHTKRIVIIGGFALFLLLLGLFRMYQLQVAEHARFKALSDHNQINIEAITAKRGLIFDRFGTLLAGNRSTFQLAIVQSQVPDMPSMMQRLSHALTLSDQQLQLFNKKKKHYRKHEPIPLKSNLSETEIARLHAHQLQLPGLRIQPHLIRDYPEGEALTPVVGYCNRITERDLKNIDTRNYKNALFIGRTGIEGFYESVLHGKQGHREIEVNARGQPQRVLNTKQPKSGKTLTLTIDAELQKAAYKAFGNTNGAAVIIDPPTGEVLALISAPSMDANLWAQGISQKQYQKLTKAANRPLFNRALSGQFPPASTLKPFFALSALKRGTITPKTRVDDPGYFILPGTEHRFRDWLATGHGRPNLTEAIVFSCDTYFYHLGNLVGAAFLEEALKPFGIGQKPKIDLPNARAGILNTPAWKRKHRHQPWYTGDTIISMIGQGNMLATPLQMAQATAQLANRGTGFHAHVLKKIDQTEVIAKPLPPIEMNPKHWQAITHAMEQVIQHPQGTGWRFGKAPYTIAAKTGTAQLFRNYGKNQNKIAKKLRDHSWFIGFSPTKEPKIALAVIAENSHQASQIARRIVDAYYQLAKKRGNA